MVVTPALLKTFPILSPLTDNKLEALAAASMVKKFSRRGIVLNAGEQEDCVCFLFEGRLQGVDFTIDGREVGLYFVEPGDFCGELGLFDGGKQLEYVIALTSAVIIAVPHKALRDLMLSSPLVVRDIGARLAGRVREYSYQRSLLGLPDISQRVCCQLWQLVPVQSREAEAAEIQNPPTHMEIAIMLSISRETVTRVFQSLQNRQIVKRDGPSRLQVLDLTTLRELAEGNDHL